MKSFAATVILAVIMLAGIFTNATYINNVGSRFETAVESLPNPSEADCLSCSEQLEKDWNNHSKWIHISVNHLIVDRIAEQFATLVACAEIKDVYGFYTARALLLDALEDMRRTERIGAVL